MNEILVLERIADPDDGMFSCFTGTINGNGKKSIATFWEVRRIDGFIDSFLRKTDKSIHEYKSTEEVLISFMEYLYSVGLEPTAATGE